MAALSNAPFSAGLSFGTSHRGSNSSCQQQPFTYLSSQYISLDSIHFTRGTFVSPPLRFFHYVCVCVCVCVCVRAGMCVSVCICANTYSMFVGLLSVLSAPVHGWVHVCVSEKQNSIYALVYPCCYGSSECARGCRGYTAGGEACEGLPR